MRLAAARRNSERAIAHSLDLTQFLDTLAFELIRVGDGIERLEEMVRGSGAVRAEEAND
jgi:hypothetical protein